MKKANLSDFRRNLREYITYVKRGETIEIQDHNVPIARLTHIDAPKTNKTKLGIGKGSIIFKGDILSAIMEDNWEIRSTD